jgi:hypothetical protein
MDAATAPGRDRDVVWHHLVRGLRELHTRLMAQGRVTAPHMYSFVGRRLVGCIELRPVQAGPDAGTGIAEMSHFAAAASADEIVTAWESCDLSVACGLIPTDPQPELNILSATPGRHVLFRFPYEEDMPGRTDDGRLRARPRCLPASLGIPDAELPSPIDALVEFCWRPLDSNGPDLLKHTVAFLLAQGYYVDLTTHG